MHNLRTGGVAAGIILGTALGVLLIGSPATSSAPVVQDVGSLDRRLRTVEQRLYSIEASINRIEQQAAVSQRLNPQTIRDPEVGVLRNEVETFSRRLVEIECGLVKVDERTLTPAARDALRRSTQAGTDPCRLNPTTPVRLSTRP